MKLLITWFQSPRNPASLEVEYLEVFMRVSARYAVDDWLSHKALPGGKLFFAALTLAFNQLSQSSSRTAGLFSSFMTLQTPKSHNLQTP